MSRGYEHVQKRLLPIYGEVAPKAPDTFPLAGTWPQLLPIYGEVAPKAPEGLEQVRTKLPQKVPECRCR